MLTETQSLAAGEQLLTQLSLTCVCQLCSVHPHLPLLATTSGQRHFPLPVDSGDEEDTVPDNSLKLWSLADQSDSSYNIDHPQQTVS